MHIHTYTSIKTAHSPFLVNTEEHIFNTLIGSLRLKTLCTVLKTSSSVHNLESHKEIKQAKEKVKNENGLLNQMKSRKIRPIDQYKPSMKVHRSY